MKKITTLLRNIVPLKQTCDYSIPVAFSSSNYFAPYLGVTIQSIIDNSNNTDKYDLIIFSKDISDFNKNILTSLVSNIANFSIRFVDLNNIFQNLSLYTPGHITIETYFRLIIPLFMKNYKKFLKILSKERAVKILQFVPEYNRWDSLWKIVIDDNELFNIALPIIRHQLLVDLKNLDNEKPVSLLAKWLPSENASSKKTVEAAKKIRKSLKFSSKIGTKISFLKSSL